jgi:predicted enzyme related to lactoylglutathione lyase
MSERDRYPAGVPCWVETLQPNLQAAMNFYGPLFGWEFGAQASMPGDPSGRYVVAQVAGRDVAGIGSPALRSGTPTPAWLTYIRVASADEAVKRALDAGGQLRRGPLDAAPAGRLAVLADPAGAPFGVWEAATREGAQLVNEPRAWALSSLRTPDTEGSRAFYGSVFGWQPETFGGLGSDMTIWRLPGYEGGQPQQPVPRDVVGIMTPLDRQTQRGSEQSHWSVDFYVDDADATADHAGRLGGTVMIAPTDTPGCRSALVRDPQGAVFSVTKQT